MASRGRTPEEIRVGLAEARHAMTVGIEGIISEIHPTAVKNKAADEVMNTIEKVKEEALGVATDAIGYFYDRKGVRWDNVGTAALTAGTVLVAGLGVRGVAGLVLRVVR